MPQRPDDMLSQYRPPAVYGDEEVPPVAPGALANAGDVLGKIARSPFDVFVQPVIDSAYAMHRDVFGPAPGEENLPPLTDQERFQHAFGGLGAMIPGSIGRAAVMPRLPKGEMELGIFGGRRAATADLAAADRAEAMLNAGVPREHVWKETGWFRGPDNKLRFEIDDSAAMIDRSPAARKREADAWTNATTMEDASIIAHRVHREGISVAEAVQGLERETGRPVSKDAVELAQTVPKEQLKATADQYLDSTPNPDLQPYKISDVVSHDPLMRAYPDLAGRPYDAYPAIPGAASARGGYDPVSDSFYYGRYMTRSDPEHRSVGLHELQHGVSTREGFARGSNIDQAVEEIGQARLAEPDLRLRGQQMQAAHVQTARDYLARAARGDQDAAAFIDQADRYWTAQLGRKSPANPYGVTPEEAVGHELARRDPVLNDVIRRYNEAFRVARMTPEEVYWKSADEASARAVQARRDLTPEQRMERPPWLDYDVPEQDQIVRFPNGRAEGGRVGDFSAPLIQRESTNVEDGRGWPDVNFAAPVLDAFLNRINARLAPHRSPVSGDTFLPIEDYLTANSRNDR